jgi:hypothetical protein
MFEIKHAVETELRWDPKIDSTDIAVKISTVGPGSAPRQAIR